MRIVAEAYAAGLPDSVRLPSDEELVQMFIRPAKCDLKYLVKISNGTITAHQEATPDLGTDFSDPDG